MRSRRRVFINVHLRDNQTKEMTFVGSSARLFVEFDNNKDGLDRIKLCSMYASADVSGAAHHNTLIFTTCGYKAQPSSVEER